jgi:hypothetical protein
MGMAGEMSFMIFPYTLLSEKEYRNLSLLLPELSILQVLRPPAVPEWLSQMVTGWPAVAGQDQLEIIRLCLKGYQEFAAVHGENSVLASLSLDQIARNFSESRLRIQSELKKTPAKAPGDGEIQVVEAAIFLEMARDLDEKNLEVETGLAQMESLEGEFREILGISEDEAEDDVMESLNPPLGAEKSGLSYMLPKRLESWFRLLFNHIPAACPVLVTTTKQAIEELIESLRGKEGPAGNVPEPACIPLGFIPAMDDLPIEDFLSLLSDPEASGILSSYWLELESTLLTPGDPSRRATLSQAADTLQDYLDHYRRELGLSAGRKVSIELVLDEALTWHALREHFAPTGRLVNPAEEVAPDESVKVLACNFG